MVTWPRNANMQYRHDFLVKEIVKALPKLELKDRQRDFTEEQRWAIYWRDKGKCQSCKKKCAENAFHADHKKAHTKGGRTTISNGMVLCSICNLKKGGK